MRIYISHPYGRRRGLSEAQCEKNAKAAYEIARKVILLGHHPEVPHFYHELHKGWKDSPDEETWFYICVSGLLGCDAILMCGNWRKSDGCLRELAQARVMTKKIYYSLEEIEGVGYASKDIARG